ncbi:MAG: phospho-N-acetylmuramoyl-pentapeptide-transferase [Candidatus Nomurabacteria bacterium]|jgi:phospho-N-acetylmuramoyl-pentapeptide-transferase|nr:phospho-N-acetylmuramoyl-pentapeptide-transferase [Candidatus Nomurabacteria bacterium]
MTHLAGGLATDELVKITLLGLVAFLIATLLTPIYTYFAYKHKFWKVQKSVDVSGEKLAVMNKLHQAKIARHIPTMAGLILVLTVIAATILWNFSRAQTWIPLAALGGGALVGLIDDVINLRSTGGVAGLRAPIKFALIALGGLLLGWFFCAKLGWTQIKIPFAGYWDLGVWLIPVFAFIVVATGNAVNITDGLDGLAGGLAAEAFTVFAVIALLQGNYGVAAFCFTILGALLSYLWFNIYPARFFMGDTGSLALGLALGAVAMMTNSLLLLPVIGLVFVVEAGSSLIQIFSKKFFHKKIFISAPLHHHLEAIGWPEPKITMRLWVIGAVCGVIGLVLALAGGVI